MLSPFVAIKSWMDPAAPPMESKVVAVRTLLKGGPVTNRYVSKSVSPHEQYFAMYGPGPDGDEVRMMEMVYTKR